MPAETLELETLLDKDNPFRNADLLGSFRRDLLPHLENLADCFTDPPILPRCAPQPPPTPPKQLYQQAVAIILNPHSIPRELHATFRTAQVNGKQHAYLTAYLNLLAERFQRWSRADCGIKPRIMLNTVRKAVKDAWRDIPVTLTGWNTYRERTGKYNTALPTDNP